MKNCLNVGTIIITKKWKKDRFATQLGIKEKEDLKKYAKESRNLFVKKSVKKVTELNENSDFIYQFSPEEDEKLIINTRVYEAEKKVLKLVRHVVLNVDKLKLHKISLT